MDRTTPRYIATAAVAAALALVGLGAISTTGKARHSAQAKRQQRAQQIEQAEKARAERAARLRGIGLNASSVKKLIATYRSLDRARLIREGYLRETAPAKGTALIPPSQRTPLGNALLSHAKDVLYGLLFGDRNMRVGFDRVERELLTLTIPRAKAEPLEFMQASTELAAAGTWQDPDSVSNDERADNIVIEVEYGEVKQEWVGDGIAAALKLINNLEVNEQLLYARMTNVEQSTLVE